MGTHDVSFVFLVCVCPPLDGGDAWGGVQEMMGSVGSC